MGTSEKPQPPDPPDAADSGGGNSTPSSSTTAPSSQADAAANATLGDKKVPAKKKKVSFKFALETSDDVHIVKKEPIASFAPPVPIIKKECLTRAIRIARGGESIIMPSRLTGLTQKFRNNTANNIDKLNSLTFKSQVTTATASSSSSDSDEDEDQESSTVSRKNRSESHHLTKESSKSSQSQGNVDTDDDDAEEDEGDVAIASRVLRQTKDSSKQPSSGVADDSTVMPSDAATATVIDNKETAATEVGGKNSGEKRFVLPKRSVHSSRVIKPNKRFMDETQASTKKNGITSRKKISKPEANETRPDSPLQPSSAKTSIDEMEVDAKDGKLFGDREMSTMENNHFHYSFYCS